MNPKGDMEKLAYALGLDPSDVLLREALTHSSAEGRSYERLEFLGDRVLNLAVAAWVYKACTGADEGAFSLIHTHLVRAETCAAVAEDLGVWPLVQSVRMVTETARARVLADVMEAVLAVVYLRRGEAAARALVEGLWAPHWQAACATEAKDAKTALQELLQARQLPLPVYKDIAKAGPDHNATFTVRIETALGSAEAQGASKALASKAAAALMLAQIERDLK